MEHKTKEIEELLEVIVQVTDALDVGITSEQFDQIYDDGFIGKFSLAVKDMRYDHRIIQRDHIVSILSKSTE